MNGTPNSEDSLAAAAELARVLGLPEGFFHALLNESDWSFVIKCHVLAEAAVRHAIEWKLQPRKVDRFLQNLRTRDFVELAKALDVLSKPLLDRYRFLSRLRNRLAHTIEDVSFSFRDYLRDQTSANGYRGLFCDGLEGRIRVGSRDLSIRDVYADNPKLGLYAFLLALFASAYRDREETIRRLALELLLRESSVPQPVSDDGDARSELASDGEPPGTIPSDDGPA